MFHVVVFLVFFLFCVGFGGGEVICDGGWFGVVECFFFFLLLGGLWHWVCSFCVIVVFFVVVG